MQVRYWWLQAASGEAQRLASSKASSIVVPPALLLVGRQLTVGVEFIRAGGSLAANSTLRIALNAPPACRLAACAKVRVAVAGLGTPFELSAAGFADAEGEELTYDFGTVASSGQYAYRRSGLASPVASVSGLPVGAHTLFTCARDTLGASACATAEVAVTPPAQLLLASAAVDVEALASSNVRFRSLTSRSLYSSCPACFLI